MMNKKFLKTIRNICIIMFIVLFVASNVQAWTGYDYEKGTYVEIGKGNLVREGKIIQIYDYNDKRYLRVVVKSIGNYGYNVKVEVYELPLYNLRVLIMEK